MTNEEQKLIIVISQIYPIRGDMVQKRCLSVIIILIVCCVCLLPSFANTSSWSFTMDYRYVNGAENGIYHKMDAGKMSISGKIWIYSKDSWFGKTPNRIKYEVWKSSFGLDENVGKGDVIPQLPEGTEVEFSKSFGEQKSGQYYLVFYKIDDDGYNIKGSGILKTE